MPRLGSLYRRFLRGSELNAPCNVEIIAATQVKVQPHPRAEPVQKWCLWVKGLPEDTPNGILFGPRGEGQLFKLFGNMDVEHLPGNRLQIYPQKIQVAGQNKTSICFRKEAGG